MPARNVKVSDSNPNSVAGGHPTVNRCALKCAYLHLEVANAIATGSKVERIITMFSRGVWIISLHSTTINDTTKSVGCRERKTSMVGGAGREKRCTLEKISDHWEKIVVH